MKNELLITSNIDNLDNDPIENVQIIHVVSIQRMLIFQIFIPIY